MDAFLTILGKTQNPEVLKKLTEEICSWPEANQSAALHALLKETQYPQVLEDLAWKLVHFSNEDQLAGWYGILNQTQDPQVLNALKQAFHCLADQCKHEAMLAISNVRNQSPSCDS